MNVTYIFVHVHIFSGVPCLNGDEQCILYSFNHIVLVSVDPYIFVARYLLDKDRDF